MSRNFVSTKEGPVAFDTHSESPVGTDKKCLVHFDNNFRNGCQNGQKEFDLNQIENDIYKVIVDICEPLEHKRVFAGSAHHFAQRMARTVTVEISNRTLEYFRGEEGTMLNQQRLSCPFRHPIRKLLSKRTKRFPSGQLRLLWELAEQGYEIEFATQGEEIICRLQCGEKESSAVSNNASSALYVALHNFKQLWGE